MAVYLFLIFLLAGLSYAYHCNIRIPPECKIAVFILLWLVAGLRFHVGKDYLAYEEMFMHSMNDNRYAVEPVWIWMMDMLRTWGFGPRAWFLFTAFVTNGLILYGIHKLSPDFYLSVLLYVAIVGCYYETFNIVRQYFAVSILFAAFHYVLEHKMWKYILAVLIASFFHVSALVMIPLIFILKIRFPIWCLWGFFIGSFFFGSKLMTFIVSDIIPLIAVYAGYSQVDALLEVDWGLLKYFYLLLGVALLLAYPRIADRVPGKMIYLNSGIVALAIYFSFIDLQVFARIGWYLFPFFTLSIPYASRALTSRSRAIVIPIVVIIFTLVLLKQTSSEPYLFDLKLLNVNSF